jgi:hypothetical protein
MKTKQLSDMEIGRMNLLFEENGPATLLRFVAQKVAHEAKDTAFGVETRIAINKIANSLEEFESRFDG